MAGDSARGPAVELGRRTNSHYRPVLLEELMIPLVLVQFSNTPDMIPFGHLRTPRARKFVKTMEPNAIDEDTAEESNAKCSIRRGHEEPRSEQRC